MRNVGTMIAVVIALAGTAVADKADALFKKGKKLLAEKKYAEACKLFEQSDELDPGIGAKLNVARCYEEWGRIATAYRWYNDAETMAVATNDDRAVKIKELIDAVDANVPRVTIKLPPGADAKRIVDLKLDGVKVALSSLGTEQRVDPGPHVIEYTVDGHARKKMAPVERGGSGEIVLEMPHTRVPHVEDVVDPKANPTEPVGNPEPEPDRLPPGPRPPAVGRTQRLVGLGLTGAGVVTVGIAGVITLSARSSYKDALSTHCMGSTSMCDPQGLSTTHDARHTANIATVVTLLGVAAAGGGVALYLLAPKHAAASDEHALYLSPVVGDDGGGLVFGGRY